MKTEPNEPITPMKLDHFQLGLIGLTKREYFASKAMEAFCNAEPNASSESIAKWSVEAADALIAELNK